MDDDIVRKDIRRLLKTFGVKADEAVLGHLLRNSDVKELKLRLTLEDLTDYGGRTPDQPLRLVIEDSVRR
jgi:hypothetical protein